MYLTRIIWSILKCFKGNSALPGAGVRVESKESGSRHEPSWLCLKCCGDERKWLISLLYLEEKPFVESMHAWQSLSPVVQRYTSSVPSNTRIRRNLNSATQCIALGKCITMITHGYYTQGKAGLQRFLRKCQIYHDPVAKASRKSGKTRDIIILAVTCAITSAAGRLRDVQTASAKSRR